MINRILVSTALLFAFAGPAMAQQMAREGSCHENCPVRTKNDGVLLACSQNSPTPFDIKWFEACLVRDGYVLPTAPAIPGSGR